MSNSVTIWGRASKKGLHSNLWISSLVVQSSFYICVCVFCSVFCLGNTKWETGNLIRKHFRET